MPESRPSPFAAIPSVDRLLGDQRVDLLIQAHGRAPVTEALRHATTEMRKAIAGGSAVPGDITEVVLSSAREYLSALFEDSLRPVLNLTGTVLHTNLGRAPLPPQAVSAMLRVASASNVEFDLATGKRGERDSHVEGWLRRLTGAEAALVVNNNAAAVLLVLNSLARDLEVPVSRGELIEIGGAFRMPDIMARAGCQLVEVGTTNRTHLRDFAGVMNERTALIMKVHTSNYAIQGFTASVAETELAALAHEHECPFVDDLGSGTLVDMTRFGLPPEPTPAQALAQGADLVTFSGDKLLGGPQCGIVVGRADLVATLRKNPLKRAMRLDKVTLAALEAVLKLYADPDRLPEQLPALRLLTRKRDDIASCAQRVSEALKAHLGDRARVAVVECASQIGSGALPVESLPSAGVAITPSDGSGTALKNLAAAFRALTVPAIGRIADGALLFDLRCLEDPQALLAQLPELKI
jgi:L-seryl-tRNA(Ser) seleniumtransferase